MRISDWSSDVCSSDLERVASASIASSAKSSVTSSVSSSALYWRIRLFSGSVRMRLKSSRVSALSSTRIGRRPCSSASMSDGLAMRSEEHTSELQSLMRISYAVFCLKKKNDKIHTTTAANHTP